MGSIGIASGSGRMNSRQLNQVRGTADIITNLSKYNTLVVYPGRTGAASANATAKKWGESEEAAKIFEYLDNGSEEILDSFLLPVPDSARKLCGQDRDDVKTQFVEAGFSNITLVEEYSREKLKKRNSVLAVSINGNSAFAENDWFPANAKINIHYKM